jgi:glucosyl-3-phosphoglycerate phosphatase
MTLGSGRAVMRTVVGGPSVMVRRVLLWRHGRTAWNVQRRFQGQSDPPLDEVGRSQAREAAAMLAAVDPDAVYSSDLARATETAAALTALTGLPVHRDRRLRERSLGRWEGLTRDEVAALYPDEYAAWLAGREDCQTGSEPRSLLADRALAVLADLTADVVVLVTHSATAIAFTGRMLGLPQPAWRGVGPLANCHWTEFLRDDHGWRLRAHNVGPAGPVVPRPVADRLADEAPPDAEALDAGPPLEVGAEPSPSAASGR